MNHTEFFKALKGGGIAPVYLFCGTESYVMKSAVRLLESTVVQNDLRDLNLTVLQNDASGEAIASACETIPFMSEKRVVIVYESGFVSQSAKPEDEDRLNSYLEAPLDTAVLVFVCEKPDKRKKIYKTLTRLAVVEFNPLSEEELARWIEKTLKAHNLTISREAMAFLNEYADTRPEMLINEIEKLADYKNGGEVTSDDILAIVTPTAEYNIFQMTDAIVAKDTKKALKLLSGILENREEPIYVLGAISKQYRRLMDMSLMLSAKKSRDEIICALGIKSFVFGLMQATLKSLNEKKLRKALDLCFETDEGLKTGGKFDAVALHTLIIELCNL